MELIERIEHKAHDHADDSGEGHAGERYIAQRQRNAGQAGNKDNRGQDHIAVLAVIHMIVNQNTQTGGADHAVQQERDTADDRTRNGLDQSCQRADERADDAQHSRAADNAHGIHLGNSHNTDVLAVGGGRHRADKAGDHGREVIREQRTVQTGILEQIAADDLAGNQLMADMLVCDNQKDRKNDQNRVDVKLRGLEVRDGDKAGVQRINDGLGFDNTGEHTRDVAADNGDQNRDSREEAAEQHTAEYRNGQRYKEGDNRSGGDAVTDNAAGRSRRACQLQADQGNNRPHGSRRQNDVDPVRAALIDNEREHTAARTYDNKAAERILITPVVDNDGRRSDKCERRAEIRGRLALGDEDEQQRADTVHEQHDRRVHLEDERHEHGRAEHRKHMLDGQRHEQARRHLFLYLNDSVALHRFFIPPKIFLFFQNPSAEQIFDLLHPGTRHIIPHFIAPFQLFHVFFKAVQRFFRLKEYGILRFVLRKAVTEANCLVVVLGTLKQHLGHCRIFAFQPLCGELHAASKRFAVAFRLREHDQIALVAVVQAAQNRDWVGQTAVVIGLATHLHRRKVDRDGAGRSQHRAQTIHAHAVEVFGLTGLCISNTHQTFTLIFVKFVPVKRHKLVRDRIEHEIRTENGVVVQQVARAEIALVATILPQYVNVALALPREIRRRIGDAGGNADDVIEHDVIIEQRIHHAAGEYRAESSAF